MFAGFHNQATPLLTVQKMLMRTLRGPQKVSVLINWVSVLSGLNLEKMLSVGTRRSVRNKKVSLLSRCSQSGVRLSFIQIQIQFAKQKSTETVFWRKDMVTYCHVNCNVHFITGKLFLPSKMRHLGKP